MILIPQFQNLVETSGTLSIAVTDDLGNLKENRFYSNIVTIIGKRWLSARMKDAVAGHTFPAQMTHMAVGGNVALGALAKPTVVDSDTVLTTGGGYSELNRQPLTVAGGSFPQLYQVTGTSSTGINLPTTSIITYACNFGTGQGTGALVEAAIFNAASLGNMLCKTSFEVVNKQATDTIAITWTINIS